MLLVDRMNALTLALLVLIQHVRIGQCVDRENCTTCTSQQNTQIPAGAMVTEGCRNPCIPILQIQTDRIRRELIVNTKPSKRSIGYQLILTRKLPEIYKKTEIKNAVQSTGVFVNPSEGSYRLIVRCLYDDNEQTLRSESCYPLVDWGPVIISYSYPKPRIGSTDPPDPVRHIGGTIAVVVVLSASILIGLFVFIVQKRFRQNSRYRQTADEEQGEFINHQINGPNQEHERTLRILVVSELNKDYSHRFSTLLETNPRFIVRSLEKDPHNVAEDLNWWIASAIHSCDVVLVLLSPSFIRKVRWHFALKSPGSSITAPEYYPSVLLAKLQNYLIANPSDYSQPLVLKAWVLSGQEMSQNDSLWVNRLFNSGVAYTLSRRTNDGVILHGHFEKLWTVLHDTINMEVSGFGRTCSYAASFLDSVECEFGSELSPGVQEQGN